MAESLVLTFAEIEFLLGAQPQQADLVRRRLHLTATDQRTSASGGASLLARGLCTLGAGTVTPGREVTACAAALSTFAGHVEAVGWIDDETTLVHLFSGPVIRAAVTPLSFGRFAVELLDTAEPLAAPVLRFLDRCTVRGPGSAVLIRFETNGRAVELAAVIDASGSWFLSTSVDSPDRGVPSTRDGVGQRLAELLDPASARAVA